MTSFPGHQEYLLVVVTEFADKLSVYAFNDVL